MAWHGMAWHGMAWHGMAWHGMAWHGMAWHGMAGMDWIGSLSKQLKRMEALYINACSFTRVSTREGG